MSASSFRRIRGVGQFDGEGDYGGGFSDFGGDLFDPGYDWTGDTFGGADIFGDSGPSYDTGFDFTDFSNPEDIYAGATADWEAVDWLSGPDLSGGFDELWASQNVFGGDGGSYSIDTGDAAPSQASGGWGVVGLDLLNLLIGSGVKIGSAAAQAAIRGQPVQVQPGQALAPNVAQGAAKSSAMPSWLIPAFAIGAFVVLSKG